MWFEYNCVPAEPTLILFQLLRTWAHTSVRPCRLTQTYNVYLNPRCGTILQYSEEIIGIQYDKRKRTKIAWRGRWISLDATSTNLSRWWTDRRLFIYVCSLVRNYVAGAQYNNRNFANLIRLHMLWLMQMRLTNLLGVKLNGKWSRLYEITNLIKFFPRIVPNRQLTRSNNQLCVCQQYRKCDARCLLVAAWSRDLLVPSRF